MFAWFVLIICFAILLMLGVNRLLARLGIRPVESDGDEGLAGIAASLERWATERKRKRP